MLGHLGSSGVSNERCANDNSVLKISTTECQPVVFGNKDTFWGVNSDLVFFIMLAIVVINLIVECREISKKDEFLLRYLGNYCRPQFFPPIWTNRDAARRKENARSLADENCANDTPTLPVADHS